MSVTHLVGVFDQPEGRGCESVCGQCDHPVKERTERKVKSKMTTHYEEQHPELRLRFRRYNQLR